MWMRSTPCFRVHLILHRTDHHGTNCIKWVSGLQPTRLADPALPRQNVESTTISVDPDAEKVAPSFLPAEGEVARGFGVDLDIEGLKCRLVTLVVFGNLASRRLG